MSRALQHFVERATALYLPTFPAWFPGAFDWPSFCGDVPEMARTSGHRGDPELERAATAVFQAAHVLALAVLAAGAEDELDPEMLLDRLATAPTDEEEARFVELVQASLGDVEERLAGAPEAAGERDGAGGAALDVSEAAALVASVWPVVLQMLAEDESEIFEAAGGAAGILGGVARVAAILAAFRWMSLA